MKKRLYAIIGSFGDLLYYLDDVKKITPILNRTDYYKCGVLIMHYNLKDSNAVIFSNNNIHISYFLTKKEKARFNIIFSSLLSL